MNPCVLDLGADMAQIIRMPEVLAGAAEAGIQTWLVQQGSAVAVDQPLAEVETDKAIVELASEFDGVIGRLLAAEGDNVAVGDPLIVLLSVGEGADSIEDALITAGIVVSPSNVPPASVASSSAGSKANSGDAHVSPAPRLEAPHQGETGEHETRTVTPSVDNDRRRFVSPLVRRIASQEGVSLDEIEGTGPNGRVVRRDLDRYLAANSSAAAPADAPPPIPEANLPTESPEPASAVFTDVPLDRMRKAIARRLTESKSTVPHFYLVADCRVDDLIALRAQLNESAPRKLSLNDFILKAVAGALVDVPAANAIWNVDSIRRFSTVDISVAVATAGGLTTPVLRGVDRMSISEVSATVVELAGRARTGKLKQHELEGGSFSVSNLGMYGVSQFSAILNPPQSGILAVGGVRKMAVVDTDGELSVGSVMTVTLSADHRVVDGAVAAQWLAALQRRIETPLTILI